jgi:hypothetical protein
MSTAKNEMAVLIAEGEAKLEIWRGDQKVEAQLVPGSSEIIWGEVCFLTNPVIPLTLMTRPTEAEQEDHSNAA